MRLLEFNAQIPNGAVHLRVPQQELDCTQVARLLVDQGDLRPPHRMGAVPLLGAALGAMRRNPTGFPMYRGKGNFSGTTNSFLRENNISPQVPESEKRYTFGGTRHTWEHNGRAARLGRDRLHGNVGHEGGLIFF